MTRRDTPTLLPPNSTLLERALEHVATQLTAIPVRIRDLWNPWTCPPEFLPWLAYGLSMDAWNPDWPLAVKRSLIATAIDIQRHKGTRKSVEDVVTAFGGAIAIREWFEMDPPGEPYTFSLVLTLSGQAGEPASARFVEEVIAEVTRTKPVRCHFTFTVGLSFRAPLALACGLRPVTVRRLVLEEAA